MGTALTPQGLILTALRNSALTEELRDAEIESLSRLVELREYKAGAAEVTFTTRGEQAALTLSRPGELSTILGFGGGDVSQVSVRAVVSTDCAILLLERARFESLLNSQSAIVSYVMRGLVRYVHRIVRRLHRQTAEMTHYLYSSRPA